MKIQTPTEFLTFNSGFCDIYSVEGNKRADKLQTLCFGDRTVSAIRLIQIPQLLTVSASNRVVIDNAEYKIEQVQQLNDTNPRVTVLTLKKIG